MESILSEHDGGGKDASMDFDTLFDTKALRIMRVLIPFFPAPYQPLLAVWIRFLQLRYAFSLLKDERFLRGRTKPKTSDGDLFEQLLPALKPCLSESEFRELARMQNMFSMYRRFQEIAPYLSALNGMSGDVSASDMMNAFSAMQGENSSMADMMNAFSAMQGENAATSDEADAVSAAQDENARHTEMQSADTPPSDSTDTGSGMDMDSILNLISLFQASSDGTDAEQTTSERQDETDYE